MRVIQSILAIAFLALVPLSAAPHDGKKDEYGCHADTATGSKHCHDPITDKELPWPPVKKSRNNICHDRESPWYDRTIHFTPFNTIKECLDSGGRLPDTNANE